MDLTEGILVQETDSTVDPLEALEEVAAANQIEQPPMEASQSAQILKEHLKRSISTRGAQDGGCEAELSPITTLISSQNLKHQQVSPNRPPR
jgi:hypothetical protein